MHWRVESRADEKLAQRIFDHILALAPNARRGSSGDLAASKAVENSVLVDLMDEESSTYTRWVFSKRGAAILILIGANFQH